MIRNTSLTAYTDINNDGSAESQRLMILRHIRSYSEGLLRSEVSEDLNIPINCVCGRINELIRLGSCYEDGDKRLNPHTNKKNLVVKASDIKVYEQ